MFWVAATGSELSAGGESLDLPPNGPVGSGMFFQPEAEPRAAPGGTLGFDTPLGITGGRGETRD